METQHLQRLLLLHIKSIQVLKNRLLLWNSLRKHNLFITKISAHSSKMHLLYKTRERSLSAFLHRRSVLNIVESNGTRRTIHTLITNTSKLSERRNETLLWTWNYTVKRFWDFGKEKTQFNVSAKRVIKICWVLIKRKKRNLIIPSFFISIFLHFYITERAITVVKETCFECFWVSFLQHPLSL